MTISLAMIVTYRAYIKKDYKPVIRRIPDDLAKRRYRPRLLALLLVVAVCTCLGYRIISSEDGSAHVIRPLPVAAAPRRATPVRVAAALNPVRDANATVPAADELPWKRVEIKTGDNLSGIFNRLGLSPQSLQAVLSTGDDAKLLASLFPGQILEFQTYGGRLKALRYEPAIGDLLQITRKGDGFVSSFTHPKPETREAVASGTIESSLFSAGEKAGMSDKLIMEMAGIFGWDIDFALDIRAGDSFKVVYQEQFKDGRKVGSGPILAAEFTNQGKTVHAVRYTTADGKSDYYSKSGTSMRKEFLRTPLKFTRISSRFSMARMNPILHKVRPHEGVDYAAPIGTPVKATGDGVVAFVGRKGGYGRAIILRHTGRFSTLYGHLSRYARHLRRGQRVRQGQVIGYVGMSGLATGPHLHYEFRINGVHHDPLTVALPRAPGIPKSQIAQFQASTAPLLAELDRPEANGQNLASGAALKTVPASR